jgi:hypothetical protein
VAPSQVKKIKQTILRLAYSKRLKRILRKIRVTSSRNLTMTKTSSQTLRQGVDR